MRGKPSRAKRYPLFGAFPLTVMTLATFLVVFAVMAARLQVGLDPGLRAASGTTVVRNPSGGKVVTRASGTGAAIPASSPSGAPAQTGTPVLTRTSGAAGSGGGGERDDA